MTDKNIIIYDEASTTDGNGSDVVTNFSGESLIMEVLNDGTATVKLQTLGKDGATYVDMRDLNRNVVTVVNRSERLPLQLEQGATVRAVISGASGTPAVKVTLLRAGRRGVN